MHVGFLNRKENMRVPKTTFVSRIAATKGLIPMVLETRERCERRRAANVSSIGGHTGLVPVTLLAVETRRRYQGPKSDGSF